MSDAAQLISYGPACDANTRPRGADTSGVERVKVGNVPYGQPIYNCTINDVVALTFDDGPWEYTEYILNLLKRYDVKATFFVVGTNLDKGFINDPKKPWPALLRRMVDEGHQIGSHTWSHQNLTEITRDQLRNQMLFNEIAIADVLGFFPTYMRPPHSMSNNGINAFLGDLGYHITYFNLNTRGYENGTPEKVQMSKDLWDEGLERLYRRDGRSILQIEHDPLEQTAYSLMEHILKSIVDNNLTTVTAGECLGDPQENWYRSL
ncbi:Polysaccharide deacetylase [Geosmithia morbida]|uniref:Polysaccharide deacetylase n=1 Tax=Geosmithia morbida TaxID=1094350 RepID=A0A9P4YTT2_9HYPO|nr:Polysaccharide deacetylase [Geosmithia morbida]KAF4122976.1 Polysaccharide deacetylase [Geosmithia morbida]